MTQACSRLREVPVVGRVWHSGGLCSGPGSPCSASGVPALLRYRRGWRHRVCGNGESSRRTAPRCTRPQEGAGSANKKTLLLILWLRRIHASSGTKVIYCIAWRTNSFRVGQSRDTRPARPGPPAGAQRSTTSTRHMRWMKRGSYSLRRRRYRPLKNPPPPGIRVFGASMYFVQSMEKLHGCVGHSPSDFYRWSSSTWHAAGRMVMAMK